MPPSSVSTVIRPGRWCVSPAPAQSTTAFARSSFGRQEREVHGAPGQLRRLALHRPPAHHLDDRGAAADRRHRALVVVLERLGLLARDAPGDRFAGVLAGLQRDRAELREDLLRLRVRDRGDVTDGVQLGMIRDGELRPDADAVSLLQVEPERLNEPVALQAGAPDERVRLEHGARLERDPRRRDRRDDLARHHLDAAFLQRLHRVRAEVRLEHREQLRARLDEDDARLVLRQVRVVLGEDAAVELGQRAGALDARRPSADDDDVQRAVLDERRHPCPPPPTARARAP